MKGNLLPSPLDTAPVKEKKFLLNHISFYFLQEIQHRYNLLGLPLYIQPLFDWNVIMQHMTIHTFIYQYIWIWIYHFIICFLFVPSSFPFIVLFGVIWTFFLLFKLINCVFTCLCILIHSKGWRYFTQIEIVPLQVESKNPYRSLYPPPFMVKLSYI